MSRKAQWLLINRGEVLQITLDISTIKPVAKHYDEMQSYSQPCTGHGCPLCAKGIPQRQRYQATVLVENETLLWEFTEGVFDQVSKLQPVNGHLTFYLTRRGTGTHTKYTATPMHPDRWNREKYKYGRYGHLVRG